MKDPPKHFSLSLCLCLSLSLSLSLSVCLSVPPSRSPLPNAPHPTPPPLRPLIKTTTTLPAPRAAAAATTPSAARELGAERKDATSECSQSGCPQQDAVRPEVGRVKWVWMSDSSHAADSFSARQQPAAPLRASDGEGWGESKTELTF